MNRDSEEDFEATYEAGDEDEDGDGEGEAVMKDVVVPPAASQPMDVLPFKRILDLDAMHALEFLEYTNIGVADLEDGEFRIEMKYNSRKLVIAAIQSYAITRRVNYVVYECEPQTFYAKCKTYGRRCDWLIRASLIWKKDRSKYVACMNIVMHRFNRRNEVFEVHEMPTRRVLVVDLARRMCNCGHFQVERLPSRHVIARCANQHLDWQVYVSDVYKMSKISKVYRVLTWERR
ncbi:hypothetical protein Ahy_A03g013302 [Arachis hypogaea]|uniref:Uncharacterized protein n=1 Tax=Arachis hypogaea TaxID=3818 RepID=A0A445DVC8_ARAHY|nr:hypothetical protein Ahy_A03g013302 [Arachis hypogaea]